MGKQWQWLRVAPRTRECASHAHAGSACTAAAARPLAHLFAPAKRRSSLPSRARQSGREESSQPETCSSLRLGGKRTPLGTSLSGLHETLRHVSCDNDASSTGSSGSGRVPLKFKVLHAGLDLHSSTLEASWACCWGCVCGFFLLGSAACSTMVLLLAVGAHTRPRGSRRPHSEWRACTWPAHSLPQHCLQQPSCQSLWSWSWSWACQQQRLQQGAQVRGALPGHQPHPKPPPSTHKSLRERRTACTSTRTAQHWLLRHTHALPACSLLLPPAQGQHMDQGSEDAMQAEEAPAQRGEVRARGRACAHGRRCFPGARAHQPARTHTHAGRCGGGLIRALGCTRWGARRG